jgi:hypothetical protein
MWNEIMIAATIIAPIAGTITGACLSSYLEKTRRAELKLDKLFLEPFERSARATAIVIHEGGSLPATSAMGFLTLETKSFTSLSSRWPSSSGRRPSA